MNMNSAPHLLPEDRPEFERALDEALRSAARRPAMASQGAGLNAEQLRTMALSAATVIAANAADEYAHFVGLRTELRRPARSASPTHAGPGAGQGDKAGDDAEPEAGGGGLSLAGAMGEGVTEAAGAGLVAMVSVLLPLLAGTAAVIFLLLGYLLHVMTPEPAIAAPMRGAGWVFAVLAAAGIVVAMVELWLTALRNGAGARRRAAEEAARTAGTSGAPGLTEEVSKARAAWREALLERGIQPFLATALADGAANRAPASYAPEPGREPADGGERTPRLGYSGPDFSSRSPSDGREERSTRPRYSSPDYSSPEYGGPEHPPE